MRTKRRKPIAIKKKEEGTALVRFNQVISTGCTVLDLALSGGRIDGGGLPGGILVEIYGPEGSGKTAVLAEICASAQSNGGDVRFRDPEARLDKEYAQIYGINIKKDFFDYKRPETVKELFTDMKDWEPKPKVINVFGADSVAATSTEMEMEDEDKRGQKQAKEFSQNLRKSARLLGRPNVLTVFTNQLREGEKGETTPGGKGIRFYATVRLRIAETEKIWREKKLKSGVKVKKVVGIISTVFIKKSTIDDPYRMCDIQILFNYGIDNIRTNLQYMKGITKASTYDCFGKSFNSIDRSVQYIEDNNLEKKLEKRVIQAWEEIQEMFKVNRKKKER